MGFVEEIKARKILNTLVFYLGSGWVLIEAVNFFVEKFSLNPIFFNYIFIIALCGLPSALAYQWFHSKQTKPGFHRIELLIYGGATSIGIYLIFSLNPIRTQNPPTNGSGKVKSIAVLSFQNLGADNQDYYGDGFADDVISVLSRIPEFITISRTSSFQYKNTHKTINQIGDELNVSNVLEGSFRIFNEQIRINVNLVDTQSGKNLWGQSFDGKISEIFELQNKVAMEIAKSLKIELTDSAKTKMRLERKVNSLAYQYYLKGKDLLRQQYISKTTLNESVNVFGKAIELDSTFAEAYLALAETYIGYLYWGYDEYKNVSEQVTSNINRAEQNDGDDGEIYSILAALSYYNYEIENSRKYVEKALELNPNIAFTYWTKMRLSIMSNDKEESLKSSEKLIQLDPLTSTNKVTNAWVYLYFDEFDAGISKLEELLKLNPDNNYALWCLGYAYNFKKDYNKAIATFLKRNVLNKDKNWALGFALGKVGRKDEALTIAKYLIDKKESGTFVPSFMIGYVYCGMNDLDNAFYWFNKSSNEKLGWINLFSTDATLEDIRKDPRYQILLDKVGI